MPSKAFNEGFASITQFVCEAIHVEESSAVPSHASQGFNEGLSMLPEIVDDAIPADDLITGPGNNEGMGATQTGA